MEAEYFRLWFCHLSDISSKRGMILSYNIFENCLFRYRNVNNKNLSALENNCLYFSTPENFNDPYDNLIYANLENILSNVLKNLYTGMDDYLEKLKTWNSLAAYIGYEFWNSSKREEIIHNQFGLIADSVDYIKKSIRKNVKIICFSEVYDSLLMWSHYANNHQGFLLAYDIDELKKAKRYSTDGMPIDNKIRLEQVKYVSKQIDLSEEIEDYVRYNMMDTMGDVEERDVNVPQYKLREAITEKAEDWKYEKEWRLIPRIIDLQKESPLAYIVCSPKAIILGTHCNKENSERIVSIAKKVDIPVYRLFLNEFSPEFKLVIGATENVII